MDMENAWHQTNKKILNMGFYLDRINNTLKVIGWPTCK
jgi:hypothetical protein